YEKLPPFEIGRSGNVLPKIPALQEEKTVIFTSPQSQIHFLLKRLKNKSNGQSHKSLQQEGFFNDKTLKKLSFKYVHECSQKKYKFFAETVLMNKDASTNEIIEKFEQGFEKISYK